jgi:hypothetical protein
MRDEITTGEAARLLGVTPSRVRQLAVDVVNERHGSIDLQLDLGRLPGRKMGRDWVFGRITVEAFRRKARLDRKDRQDRAAIAAGLRAHPAAKRRR